MIRVVGRLLRGWRAGAEYRVAEDERFANVPRTMALTSSAFASGGPLPQATTSPSLAWAGVPAAAQSLVLIVEDVDAPFPRPLVHALAYDIDPTTTHLDAGALDPAQRSMGYNGTGGRSYIAPAPIPGHGVHHYVFTLLAIAFVPHFDQAPTRGRLLDAVAGHVLDLAELTATRER